MTSPQPVLLGERSWVEVVELADAQEVVLLPVGAVEQHGPHLPLLVDAINVEGIACEASRRTGVAVAPTLVYSSSQGHSPLFPGTMALSPQTTETALHELCLWLANAGFRKLFVLNGHFGNTGVLWNAVDRTQHALPHHSYVGGRSWWDLSPELWRLVTGDCPIADWEFHANWGETALMLHLRPDLVRMDRAVDVDDVPYQFAHNMAKKSESGAIGRRTSQATAEDGRAILDAAAQELSRRVELMRAEEVPFGPVEDVAAWRRSTAARYLDPISARQI